MPAKNSSNEIRITRIYDAPVEAVWNAWTDSAQVAQWWGPRGFSLTTHSKDLRPGGHWSYTMHGPDGTDYENKTIYFEVEQCKKLVYDHGGNDDRPPLFRVTVLFSATGGKTKMDMSMTLPTPEAAEQTRKFIKQAGGNGTWDRLAEYLEKEASGKERFVINRTFESPLDLVFDMWTKPEHVSSWLPPTGFSMKYIRADIRPGGDAFFIMTNGSGITMHGRMAYLDVCRPDRLVYTQQFCDEKENITRHPMAPVWPETLLMTVQFAEEEPGLTRVTLTCEPQGTVASEELQAFILEKGGMTQGWAGSFDKLEGLLEKH
ncbi:MAG: hypothetical protein K0S28_1265 [Paucimonas sp.]|jgi:uncharacterized protein YndB with AHSA1/START domain|nr:hypothetical protein [Paucimonas sp.]